MSAWYAITSTLLLATLTAIALYATHISTRGHAQKDVSG
jgi:hypothetical protein